MMRGLNTGVEDVDVYTLAREGGVEVFGDGVGGEGVAVGETC